jgi:hypothetical protein
MTTNKFGIGNAELSGVVDHIKTNKHKHAELQTRPREKITGCIRNVSMGDTEVLKLGFLVGRQNVITVFDGWTAPAR